MSKIGNHRTALQEHPRYEDGWNGYECGWPRDYVPDDPPLRPHEENRAAWELGWDDAKSQFKDDEGPCE